MSFGGALLINLFLTPVIGLISVIRADKSIITHHYINTSTCTSCDIEANNPDSICPICGVEMENSIIKDGKLGVI